MIIYDGLEFELNIGSCSTVKVNSHLGTGGFGDVWKVTERITGKVYAIKHIRISETDPTKLARAVGKIYTEVSSVGTIDSEYIVKTYGVKQIIDSTASITEFIILYEFVDGLSLDDWLEITTNWVDRKNLFGKILQGIKSAHDKNIIHRDIKPQNILITKDNNPKIVDFGLAKVDFIDIETTVKLTATLPYAAPEYLTGKLITNKYDVYSLGCLLYTFVKGKNYCEICGFSMPPILKMIDAKGLKNDNILSFDPSFDLIEDERIPIIIKKSTNFNPDLRYNNVDDFINDWNSEKDLRPPFDFNRLLKSRIAPIIGLIIATCLLYIIYMNSNTGRTDFSHLNEIQITNDSGGKYRYQTNQQLEDFNAMLDDKSSPQSYIERVFNNNTGAEVIIVKSNGKKVNSTVQDYFLNANSDFKKKTIVPVSCKITTTETPSGSTAVYLNSITVAETE